MGDLVYVYAVAPRPAETAVEGIDTRPVRWLVEAGLAAAVSDVPVDDFDEAPLNERIGDMRWLAPRAVAHQQVNARLHATSPSLLPLAFGTVFRDEAGVRDLLRRQGSELAERLARVAGCSEWVLAVHRDDAAALAAVDRHSPVVRQLQAEIDAATPGRAHLLRRRLADVRRRELVREEARALDELLGEAVVQAQAVYREPVPAEADERPLLRASLLVRRADEAALLGSLERLEAAWQPRGYRLVLTGPWPAYRFSSLQPDEVHAGAV